jgi:phosphoribosylformylglycinamidine synthase I
MATPRVLILRAPGTNCDRESAFAFEQAGAKTAALHVNQLLERPALAADYQILCLPGGFSYGDDISAGRILANQIRHHLFDTLQQFKADGKLILGVCNGFQILIKSGLLLPDQAHEPIATLAANASGKFEDRWVNLVATTTKCVFLQGIERMYLPVAHGEGRFLARDAATLNALEAAGQLCLRYATDDGATDTVPYPLNPAGAERNVAGVCDDTGRVLGLMPHPERHIDPTHHPRWTRREQQPRQGDGLKMFQNAVQYFA